MKLFFIKIINAENKYKQINHFIAKRSKYIQSIKSKCNGNA